MKLSMYKCRSMRISADQCWINAAWSGIDWHWEELISIDWHSSQLIGIGIIDRISISIDRHLALIEGVLEYIADPTQWSQVRHRSLFMTGGGGRQSQMTFYGKSLRGQNLRPNQQGAIIFWRPFLKYKSNELYYRMSIQTKHVSRYISISDL